MTDSEDHRRSQLGRHFALATAVVIGGLLAYGVQPSPAGVRFLPGFDGELAAWAPDSRTVAEPNKKAIRLRRAGGKFLRRLRGPGINYFGWPCECGLGWSDDGRRVQFLSQDDEFLGDTVVGSAAVDGHDVQHRPLGLPVGSGNWAPTGWPLIYVPNSRGFRIPSGKRVGPNPDLWRLDSLFASPRKILSRPGEEDDVQFSPDGSQVTFTRAYRGADSLWRVNTDGTRPRRLAAHLLGSALAAWSPDGRLIALATHSRHRNDRRCHLYVISANGGPLRQIVRQEILIDRPAWTPDGKWITYTNYGGEIRKIRPDGTGDRLIRRLPGKEIRGLGWSPDGERLGYTARRFPRGD